MPFYKPNSNGNYLSHCNPHPAQEIIEDDNVSVILNNFNNNWNIRETRLKDLIDDVYHNLERTEGFHYGVSEAAWALRDENGWIPKRMVTCEHAVPSTIVIEEMRNEIENESITTEQELLNFLRTHFYMCLITKNEDNSLRIAGLHRRMPETWNRNWNNWIVRYNYVGINLNENHIPTGH